MGEKIKVHVEFEDMEIGELQYLYGVMFGGSINRDPDIESTAKDKMKKIAEQLEKILVENHPESKFIVDYLKNNMTTTSVQVSDTAITGRVRIELPKDLEE